MTELSASARENLNIAYRKLTEHAANSFDEYQRSVRAAAELASDLVLSQTEQAADYQAALTRAEARGR